ncbi:BZ3500_MvSof-1268-A1-R1_Chr1-1g00949 [Microbotryum saponariae]|uniref:BZ3500_MvSof-1268-A1-R1_Chr1-1g00949 protein n=1 Tax=Microbotryum saponariae TaxID=289078 RepID=A0A2X0KJR2_9BASI|nr:BZ3500_MvSof-1268-A1-R1_Chr1-1g00949 [Microbotryum saponariae]SCZ93007.1 BZ3501_MvSof-1269-A2-R1_Chr1-1g00546 [Microbotryum saponariae]
MLSPEQVATRSPTRSSSIRNQDLASSFRPDSLSAPAHDPVPVPIVETPPSTRIARRRSARSSVATRDVVLGSMTFEKHPKAGMVEEPIEMEVDTAEQLKNTHGQEEAVTALERPLSPPVEPVASTSPKVATATATSAEPSLPLPLASTSTSVPPPPPTSPPHPTPTVTEPGFKTAFTALDPDSSPLSDRESTPARTPSPSPSPRKVATKTITEVEEMAESLAEPEAEAPRGVDRLPTSPPPPPEPLPTPEQSTIVDTRLPEPLPGPIPTPTPPPAGPLQRLLNPVRPPIVPSLPVSPTTERPPPPERPTPPPPQTQSPVEAKVQVEPSPPLPKTTNPPPSNLKVMLPAQSIIRKTAQGGLSFKRLVDVPVELDRSGIEDGEQRGVGRGNALGSVGGEASVSSVSSNAMDVDSTGGKEQVVTLSGRPKRNYQTKGKGNAKTNTKVVEALPAPESEAQSNHIEPGPSEPAPAPVPTTPADSSVPEPIASVISLPTKTDNVEDIFNDDSGDEFEEVVGPKVGVKQVGEVDEDGEKDGQMEVEVEGEEGLPKLKLKLGGKGNKEPKEVKGSTPVSNATTTNKGSGMGKQIRQDKAREKQEAKGKEKDKPDPSPKKRSHPEPSVPGPSSKKLVTSASSKASTPLATVSTPGPTTTTTGNGGGGGTPSAAGVGSSGRPLPSSSSSSGIDLSKMNKIKSSVFHPQAKKKPNTVANPLAQFLAPKMAPGVGAAGSGKKASAMTAGKGGKGGEEEEGKRSRYGSGYEPATEEKHKEMAERRIREREERERSRGQGFNLLAQIDSMAAFEHKYRSMYAMRMNEARFVEDRPLPRAQTFGAVFSYFPSKVEEGDEVVGAM